VAAILVLSGGEPALHHSESGGCDACTGKMATMSFASIVQTITSWGGTLFKDASRHRAMNRPLLT